MSIRNRFQKLKGSKTSIEDDIVKLMEHFHWTIEDVKKLTIPSYFQIVASLNKMDRQNKAKANLNKRKGK